MVRINTYKRDDIFAGTPPLETNKMLLSMAVTDQIGCHIKNRRKGMRIEFIDATRAYYQAAATREIYVELPPGDKEEGMCGKLLKSIKGVGLIL